MKSSKAQIFTKFHKILKIRFEDQHLTSFSRSFIRHPGGNPEPLKNEKNKLKNISFFLFLQMENCKKD